jgi:glycosyltransferase involved in cell wall biosynthesis
MSSIQNGFQSLRKTKSQRFDAGDAEKFTRPHQLSILYVSYPLLTVSEEAAGGAEQMLLTLEQEITGAGHRTTVAASNGSSVAGRLLPTGEPARAHDACAERERHHTKCVLDYLQDHPGEFDLIHDESGSFFRHAARCSTPVLATLHLPHSFYPDFWFQELPSNVHFNCVSHYQSQRFSDLPNMQGVIQNGIAYERFPFTAVKGDYLLWLGRICEEKAPHLAIAAAEEAGVPLIIAGQVYPFSYHQQYYEREIRPRLGNGVQLVDSPLFEQKLQLLCGARALLLTSTAEETSSLVAMEAMACGTPVVAMYRGAFPEIVDHGGTGFVVYGVEEMVAALESVAEIDSAACRKRVEESFCAKRMADEYEDLYRRVLVAREERLAA